jgi:hypothetical protein
MSLITDIVKGIGHGPKIRDWQHASKIFTSNNYALKPKDSYLFHVYFNINQAVSRLSKDQITDAALLVKSVQIPKFTIENKTYNAYNRPNIVQQKIKYDPITITFHDDHSDVVRNLWYDYYSHYYRDSDYTDPDYLQSYKYENADHPAAKNFWGYQPASYQGSSERLLNSITIYSLHQRQFSEYVLINPIITAFQHGQHTQGQSEFLENTMTISYESVLYKYGANKLNAEPTNLGSNPYDNASSPLTAMGGGTTSILGPGGLLSAGTGIASDMGSPLGYMQAGATALNAYNNFKGQNVMGMAGTELKNIGMGILSGDTNTLNRLALPKATTTPGQAMPMGAQTPISE